MRTKLLLFILAAVFAASCGKKEEPPKTDNQTQQNQQQQTTQQQQQQTTQHQTQTTDPKKDEEKKKEEDKKKEADKKKEEEKIKDEMRRTDSVRRIDMAPGKEYDFSALWGKKCVKCHGSNGKGKVEGVPDLTRSETKKKSLAELKKIITNGVKGKTEDDEDMPSWDGKMSPDEIDAAAKYVKKF